MKSWKDFGGRESLRVLYQGRGGCRNGGGEGEEDELRELTNSLRTDTITFD
jgi:hypothetical protein